MKIAIFSHCTIDEISRNDIVVETAGGPACYCGLTAKNMKFEIDLHTKVGKDFSFRTELEKKGIFLSQSSISDVSTTRFLLKIFGTERDLYLKTKCEPIESIKSDADGAIVSPVFDEVSEDTLDAIKENFDFTLLDPQGYLRRVDDAGKVFLEKTLLDLSGITAIKTDPDEAFYLTGLKEKEAMIALQKKGVKHVLYTDKQNITMLAKDRMYHLKIPNVEIGDTTGVGDIFCAAFTCSYLKEKDAIWAICFAVGAAQAALETKATGLGKVPLGGDTERNAAYLYNLMQFSSV
ncbi:PfkB family carbohydrate kinase [Candidatus Nitrosotalea bavarica]|uniref:PfkB family carbohydrate kinase n=1 Tax=Candidatus Nitrosotalea bavarica TaxID=1903277 RepID=UPI000C701CC1|nr:PfkB family carbohydrate kinase [Candidatus Nitrosotalea bavarica]